MTMNFAAIIPAILQGYILPIDGLHGLAHWARVLENGRRLAAETGANVDVVSLFAIFHDSRRVNEATDPLHGRRGADLAAELRGRFFDLPDREFDCLYQACVGHTRERTHSNLTIQVCWDSDRLDLGRVGITPHPSRLCSEVAKRPDIIHWADGRACFGIIPMLILDEWKIDLQQVCSE